MERVVNFVGNKAYSKQDGTYIVAEVRFPKFRVYVAAVMSYVVVAIPDEVQGEPCYVTYVATACLGDRRSWADLSSRDKEEVNSKLIKRFYEVLNVLEKGEDEDCEYYLQTKYDRLRYAFHTDLTQFQWFEVDTFLKDIDNLRR